MPISDTFVLNTVRIRSTNAFNRSLFAAAAAAEKERRAQLALEKNADTFEALQSAAAYLGEGDAEPQRMTRGLYYRGVQ